MRLMAGVIETQSIVGGGVESSGRRTCVGPSRVEHRNVSVL